MIKFFSIQTLALYKNARQVEEPGFCKTIPKEDECVIFIINTSLIQRNEALETRPPKHDGHYRNRVSMRLAKCCTLSFGETTSGLTE